MNNCFVSGKIEKIDVEYKDKGTVTRFGLRNKYFKPTVSTSESALIRCVAFGGLADYINSELYEGANVLVTGRIASRTIPANNTIITYLYVACHTVTLLEQEEYS